MTKNDPEITSYDLQMTLRPKTTAMKKPSKAIELTLVILDLLMKNSVF